MAIYLVTASTIYPEGTVLFAYSRANIPIGHQGSPVGTAIDSATMEDGSALFVDLDVGNYVAAGLVGTEWRYMDFSIDQPPHLGLFTDSELPAAEITGPWRFKEQLQIGYNPSIDLEPDNPKAWPALDHVLITGRGTGNRAGHRSMNLTNVGDPPELVFRRSGPKGSDPYGPSGGGPTGEGDGTEIEGLNASATMGFIGWQGFVPTDNESGGSFQSFSVVEGASLTEDARQDILTVTLAAETDAEAETITITGDMDDVQAPVDGRAYTFYDVGTVSISGRTIRYRARSATKLFGCTLENGDVGTLAAGANVNQTRVGAGGAWQINTAIRTTGTRYPRLRIHDDGQFIIGSAAISAGPSKFFTVGGGNSHFKQIRKISNLTAAVVGTPGTATITYKVVQRSPDGAAVDPVSVTINNAPNVLNATDYVTLDWVGGLGTSYYDILRTATDGTPATTGAIIRHQPWIRGPGAADTGLAPTGINEVQQISFSRSDGGTFRLSYADVFTSDLDYPPSAATIETALEGLAGIGAGNVNVTGGGDTFQVEYISALAAENVSLIGADPTNLTNADDPPHTPHISTQTIVPGLDSSYVEPTRNETGDVTIDGILTAEQGMNAGGDKITNTAAGTANTDVAIVSQTAPSNWNLSGTHAARPAAGTAGRTYFETDTGVLYRDTGAAWQATGPGMIRKTANQTLTQSSTTLQNVTQLSLPVEVGENWFVEVFLLLVGNSTSDWEFGWTGPAAASMFWGAFASSAVTAGNWNAVDIATTANTLRGIGQTILLGGHTGTHPAHLAGMVRNPTNAGTLQLQAAQDTAQALDNIIAADSWMRVTRIV